jgi:predicted RNase H-like HicB family nuclease
MIMEYKVKIYSDEKGFFIAECLDLKGCISDGKTKKEAIKNIKEAILAYNESMRKENSELVLVTV